MNSLMTRLFGFTLLIVSLMGCKENPPEPAHGTLQIKKASAGTKSLSTSSSTSDVLADAVFSIEFLAELDSISAKSSVSIVNDANGVIAPATVSFTNGYKTILISPVDHLDWFTNYKLVVSSQLKGKDGSTFSGVEFPFKTENGKLVINTITINNLDFSSSQIRKDIKFDEVVINITFSDAINTNNINDNFNFYPSANRDIEVSADKKNVIVRTTEPLSYWSKYYFSITSNLQSVDGFELATFSKSFHTSLDSTDKFPIITDNELLDKIQYQTFRYFWDFGHPVSGLARERNSSGDVVTTGGSGFGLMALIVGVERGFITRTEAVDRFSKIVNFLATADRFHGAWPHWMNGATGKVYPFSQNDNGGDLVETSYMAAGLLTLRQYLQTNNETENAIIIKINDLLATIEWSWYQRNNQEVLYWHWSPTAGWAMNMQIKGYNEALITYFMAATSSTFGIDAAVYHNGWAASSYFINGKSFYGYTLPLGFDYGGPMFFAHYTFLGLNPSTLTDMYANYWEQNTHHSLINFEHCKQNPSKHIGYSADCWGLTASDEKDGYSVHEPTNDNGTISPTAAVSSLPYAPEESMRAIRFFYYKLGDKLWGDYGFYDAFNADQAWWADSYLAIDQGPMVVMIENYRTGLIWNLFMSAPETQQAMSTLGFITK